MLRVARVHENGFEMFCCIYLTEASSASWQVLAALHRPRDVWGVQEHPICVSSSEQVCSATFFFFFFLIKKINHTLSHADIKVSRLIFNLYISWQEDGSLEYTLGLLGL